MADFNEKVTTDNTPRPILGWHDLTDVEREEFDYIDSPEDAKFFRYKGGVYDLGEATVCDFDGQWDGVYPESAFSAVLVYVVDSESVIVGRVAT